MDSLDHSYSMGKGLAVAVIFTAACVPSINSIALPLEWSIANTGLSEKEGKDI